MELSRKAPRSWNEYCNTAEATSRDIWKAHRGVAKRSLFVIRPDGTIAYRWVTEDALELPDFDDLMTAVRSL
ncbi:MAG TPA: hypothetical protein VM848_03755 [Acidimicrobiia bacterium]|nr:hypothetical protein [Acidimicrobiia bacterium]